MAQDPILVDGVQIEPGAAGTRLIDRDSSTGELQFTDPENTGGISLSGLAGLRSVGSILTVGLSGPGAQYNTVTDALAAVPASSSLLSPTLILVGPGVFTENIVIEKDGIWLCGLGGAIIKASAADATVLIQKAVSTTPNWCQLQNLRIVNDYAGEECVLVTGGAASEVGSTEIGIVGCELVAEGVGTYQLRADTANRIRIQGGTFEGSTATSLVRATNCQKVSLSGVETLYHVQLDYDTANPTPFLTGCSYQVNGGTLYGNLQSTLNGTGEFLVSGTSAVSGAGDMTLAGDGSGTFYGVGCRLGAVTVNTSAPLVLSSCSRTSIAGAGTIAEDMQQGSASFAASSSEAVVFPVAHPDNDYTVHPETELTEPIGVTSKTATGFTLSFSGVQTTTANYKILRQVS